MYHVSICLRELFVNYQHLSTSYGLASIESFFTSCAASSAMVITVSPPLSVSVASLRCSDHVATRRRSRGVRFCSASAQPSGDGGAAVTTPFHLAIPVHDVHAARKFFGGILGCPEGRSAKTWVDFNLFGHQVVCHEVQNYNASSSANAVDGDPVPVPHFGLAMSVPEFHAMAERVRAAGVKFIIEPHLRFEGQPGEQWTMFFKDSSGNALEFKAMTTPSNLFAKYVVE